MLYQTGSSRWCSGCRCVYLSSTGDGGRCGSCFLQARRVLQIQIARQAVDLCSNADACRLLNTFWEAGSNGMVHMQHQAQAGCTCAVSEQQGV